MSEEKKPVRIWLDGCFDMYHYGHANAIRQAKLAGDILVVGVHGDEQIRMHKALPVMKYDERRAVVDSCKWVDEIVDDAPYVTDMEVLKKHNITYCVHGEDISTDENGNDSFQSVKDAGMFKLIKRTEGVSTTDIVSRMLLVSKSHFKNTDLDEKELNSLQWQKDVKLKQFLTTSRKIVQFSEGGKTPKPNDKIVYVDGAFDLFHIGHVKLLERAKERGDFLIVGIHADKDINKRKGYNFPILNLHERALTVMGCKYVDEVVIGAPYHISEDMIKTLKIDKIIHGDDPMELMANEPDPMRIPKDLGIYEEVPHTPGISTQTIIKRIIDNRLAFEERNRKKHIKDSLIKPPEVPQEVLENA